MAAKIDKKYILAGAAGLVVIVILWVVMRRKPKAEAPELVSEPLPPAPEPPIGYPDNPVDTPIVPIDPPPKPSAPLPAPKPEPDPLQPTTNPIPGRYYAVKKGDTMKDILAMAGFEDEDIHKAYKKMLNHEKNDWIGDTNSFGPEVSLRLFMRFEPLKGYESETWAHKTKFRLDGTPGKWPSTYIPGFDEV